MKLSDGTILMHGRVPYDPVKAHEYYMRTRHLKGRKAASSYTVKLASGKTVKLSEKQLVEQRALIAKRVNDIKNRLTELNHKLVVMMSEAKKKKNAAKREASKKPTAADKSKAAKESKQYRDTHKAEIAADAKKASRQASGSASKQESTKKSKETDPVAALEHQISQVKGRLVAAVARQRALATASKLS